MRYDRRVQTADGELLVRGLKAKGEKGNGEYYISWALRKKGFFRSEKGLVFYAPPLTKPQFIPYSELRKNLNPDTKEQVDHLFEFMRKDDLTALLDIEFINIFLSGQITKKSL